MSMIRIAIYVSIAAVLAVTALALVRHLGGQVCGDASTNALGTLRVYAQAQHDFYSHTGRFGTADDLNVNEGLTLDAPTFERGGYEYSFAVSDDGSTYRAEAHPVLNDPTVRSMPLKWHFAVSSSDGLRRAVDRPARPTDESLPIQ